MPKWLLGLLAIVFLHACATSSVKLAPERPDAPWKPQLDPNGKIVAGEPMTAAATSDRSFTLPKDTMPVELAHDDRVSTSHNYSLLELIDLAESNNPSTSIAWNTAREVALAAGIARSAYLPRLTAAAVGGHQTSQIALSGPTGSNANNGQGEGAITSLSLNWLLFDFGQRDSLVEAADQATVVANVGFNASHQILIHTVSVAFYNHSAAKARVALAEKSLQNAALVEEIAVDRLKQGIGTIVEAGKAEQGSAQAKLLLVQAKGAEKNTHQALVNAMGISPLTKLKTEDISSRKLDTTMSQSVEQIVSDALARRPDMLAAYAEEKSAKAMSEAAEADFLPKLFVSGTGSYSTGGLYLTQIPSIGTQSSIGNFGSSGFGATVFGGVTMSLYDGGTKDALLEQAKAKEQKATLNITQKRNLAVKEIVSSQDTLETGLSTYQAASKAVKASQLSFDSTMAAYKSGAGSITDALIAESQLLQAQIIFTEAHSASLAAAATLALATGSMDSVIGVEGQQKQ